MNLIEMIKRHEWLRLNLYKDTVGKYTIGWGRNIDDVGIMDIGSAGHVAREHSKQGA